MIDLSGEGVGVLALCSAGSLCLHVLMRCLIASPRLPEEHGPSWVQQWLFSPISNRYTLVCFNRCHLCSCSERIPGLTPAESMRSHPLAVSNH